MHRLALLLALALPVGAMAQSVTLSGMLGKRALLIIDGGAPRAVAPGETLQGVTVVSTEGEEAVLEIKGKRQTLRVGDAPSSVGQRAETSSGTRIVLPAGSGGHFMGQGRINGSAAQFLVDTGASLVVIGATDADRMRLDYRNSAPVPMGTANGTVPAWRVRLASIRLGDVEVYDVEAVVTLQAMPFVLLGNSYLTRFQMKRENDQLTLERRY